MSVLTWEGEKWVRIKEKLTISVQKFVSQTKDRHKRDGRKSAAEIVKDTDNGSCYGCTSCLSVDGSGVGKKKKIKHISLLTGETADLLRNCDELDWEEAEFSRTPSELYQVCKRKMLQSGETESLATLVLAIFLLEISVRSPTYYYFSLTEDLI